MQIKDIINHLEEIAPPAYQESYDNSGLLVGDSNAEVKGVVCTLDVTEKVIEDAIASHANLIVAHHPLIFKGMKRLTGRHWVERCVIMAIKHDIAIYAIHTNLDHVHTGVNCRIAEKLSLQNLKILAPKTDALSKLVTFIPHQNADRVLQSMYDAGAGQIGKYDHCSYQIDGMGTFRPGNEANPHIGSTNQDETVNEKRVELIFPTHLSGRILAALKKNHPYEEVAYYLSSLQNPNQEVGAGMIGNLPEALPTLEFLQQLKTKMNTSCIRHTAISKDTIEKVAICGGAGSFLLRKAISEGADIFITGDFKYHEFFEAENKLIIADIGHYESEQFTKHLLYDIIREKFTNIALRLTEVETNPINYL